MNPQRHNIVFVTVFLLFSFIFFLLKDFSPSLITLIYQSGHLELLNKLSGTPVAQNLGYYLGEAENRFFGPIKNLLAVLLFAIFAFTYLKEKGPRVFSLALIIFLLVTCPEVLFFPAYGGDAVTGPFAEAIWLARNSFDYIGLYHQPGYTLGGPNVYLVSIYPTFLALQMLLVPAKPLFYFLNHFLTFIMAAVIISLLREILAKVFDKGIALLIPLLVFSSPIFQSQIEMINMEMPTLFFVFLSAYYLARQKLPLATILGIVAALVKGSGVIACGAIFFMCLFLFFFLSENRHSWKTLRWGIAALLGGMVIVWATTLVRNPLTHVGYIKLFVGTVWGKAILNIFLICLFIFGNVIRKSCLANRCSGKPIFFAFLTEHYHIFVLFLYAGMWFLLYLNFSDMVPRYKLLVLPFFLPCVFYCFQTLVKSRRIQLATLFFMIGLWSFASFGLLETQAGNFNYVEIERSLEYRNVLLRDIRLAKEVEKNYSSYTVVAPSVVAQILAWPELGYVQKSLPVVTYLAPCQFAGIKNFAGRSHLDNQKTLWIGIEDDFSDYISTRFPFPVDSRDVVLEKINYGNKQATLFLGGYAIDKIWELTARAWMKRHYQNLPTKE